MIIKRIEGRVHEVPVTIPGVDDPVDIFRFGTCRVELEDGTIGFGLSGRVLAHSVAEALNRDFNAVFAGMRGDRMEAVAQTFWRKLNPRAQTGVAANAYASFDIALWDALGKQRGEPVWSLLGGHKEVVQTYTTFGFPDYTIEQLTRTALEFIEAGDRRLKMVVGVHEDGWREDAKRVKAVRKAIGPDIDLAIDANYMFSPWDAKRLSLAIEDHDISWFEEPLFANDPDALRELRRSVRIPIAVGQMDAHRWRLREFIQRGSVDLIQPNVCYSGFTEARKVVHMAQAYNIDYVNGGGWPHFNMHLVGAMLNGRLVEMHLTMKQLGERIFPDVPRPVNGELPLPKDPGLGYEVDEAFLEAHRVR